MDAGVVTRGNPTLAFRLLNSALWISPRFVVSCSILDFCRQTFPLWGFQLTPDPDPRLHAAGGSGFDRNHCADLDGANQRHGAFGERTAAHTARGFLESS